MRLPTRRRTAYLRVLPIALAAATLSAGFLSFQFLRQGESAAGFLAAGFAALTGILAVASAQQSTKKPVVPPVRFVSHAFLMAALVLTLVAILVAVLLPMLRR